MDRDSHASAQAPGALAVVQAFINTRYGGRRRYHEALDSPAHLYDWLTQQGLLREHAPISEGDLRRAISVREALRTLLRMNTPAPRRRQTALIPDAVNEIDEGDERGEPGDVAAAEMPGEGVRLAPRASEASTGEALAAAMTTLNVVAQHMPVAIRFLQNGHAELAPDISGMDGALARLLAAVPIAQANGSWRLLKICRNDACGSAFYDTSKNHTGAWCAMSACGNRMNARNSRARRRQENLP